MADWPAEAREHFEAGYRAQREGRLDEAIESYQGSIRAFPTAEAHTFLGWAYSQQRRWEAAIRECEIAIRLDPDFGNPYNDVGAYLIELGRPNEAIGWFEKAKRAKRYEPRHFPHFNLSRVYARQGKIREAIRELEAALALEPEYLVARRELHRLVGMLN